MTAAACAEPPIVGLRASIVRRNAFHSVPALLAAATFLLSRPYLGLDGDARLYFGSALANADPHVLGTDYYFAYNGQFALSIFSALTRGLVPRLGPSAAGLLIAGAANLCCFVALVRFAQAVAPGSRRLGWLIVLFVTLLPASFDVPSMFEFSETLAVPRPFAEAAVLAALACLLEERWASSLAFAVLAVAIHPIMGFVGVVVIGLVLLARAARPSTPLVLAGAGCIALAAASLVVHVPLVDRLFQRMDDAWLDLVVQRSPHLFPTLWAPSEYANLCVQCATIAIAARQSAPAVRQVLLAIIIAGVGAIAAAGLFGDVVHSVLFIQAQLWRSVWLVSLAAAVALALCVAALPRQDDGARLAFVLLALGWVFVAQTCLAVGCAATALVLRFDGRLASRVGRPALIIVSVVAVAAVLAWNGAAALVAARLISNSGALRPRVDLLASHAQTLPLLLLAAWSYLAPESSPPCHRSVRVAAVCGAVALLVAGMAFWDERDVAQLALDRPQVAPAFETTAAGRSSEVLWVDGGSESWFALGRPQWLSHLQAVGIVFSRPLAFEWHRRAEIAWAAGLVRPSLLRRPATDVPAMTAASIVSFCARSDAPGTIIFHWRPEEPALTTLAGPIWRPDGPQASSYKIIPCAPQVPVAPATKPASTATRL